MTVSTTMRFAGASLLALAACAPALAQTTPAADATDQSTIIVTGTRTTGLKAADSPAPIQLLGADTLQRVGQPNLNQALAQLVPSFTAETFGGDAANLTLTARLRGLNPNHTLILVNGKRRHGSASLHVLGGPYQGAASPDLDLIPAAAIERIEILQDGAAAQYGSDAIAGVINIILKKDRSGGTASVTGGSYYQGGGDTFAQTARFAVPLGDKGYFDLTAFHRWHDFSVQGGADRRLAAPDGTPLTGNPSSWTSIPGFPELNPIVGDAKSHLTTGFYNAGYDFGGVEVYSFGSYGRRVARANENYRLPNRISRTVGGVTTLFAPSGFVPQIGLVEDDYSFTGGVKGETAGWSWDLSGTYGQDRTKFSTLNSANASLYTDTGFTPTDFYDGSFAATQYTGNLDIKRDVDVGFAEPLTIAFGGEYRWDRYVVKAGDAASRYGSGAQSYPGFQPSDAGSHSRKAGSGYIDLATKPVENWSVDLAGRFEHYSDFGSKVIGKLTTRYDFSDAFALRGTVSNGFRAPTLAESYYSNTNVSPTSAVVQLPANSAAAAIIGFGSLKPEKSTNFSAGLVAHPTGGVTFTLDLYQISIKDRIAASGTILGLNGTTVVNQKVIDAIKANGNSLDPTVTFVGASVFANGINTRTRGIEAALSYTSVFDIGRIDWSLTGNYNKTVITANKLGAALFNDIAASNLEKASPRYKVNFGALFTSGAFTVNLRETLYGKSSQLTSPSGSAPFYNQKIGTAGITDLEVAFKPASLIEFAVGANNLFNKRPPVQNNFVPGTTTTATSGPTLVSGGQVYDAPYTFSPYGINGGYYYGRVTLNF
jgi:iron complex outermembrane receptor protein